MSRYRRNWASEWEAVNPPMVPTSYFQISIVKLILRRQKHRDEALEIGTSWDW
jgi:hypothetical protein